MDLTRQSLRIRKKVDQKRGDDASDGAIGKGGVQGVHGDQLDIGAGRDRPFRRRRVIWPVGLMARVMAKSRLSPSSMRRATISTGYVKSKPKTRFEPRRDLGQQSAGASTQRTQPKSLYGSGKACFNAAPILVLTAIELGRARPIPQQIRKKGVDRPTQRRVPKASPDLIAQRLDSRFEQAEERSLPERSRRRSRLDAVREPSQTSLLRARFGRGFPRGVGRL